MVFLFAATFSPFATFCISVAAAWKAAGLLQADNELMAVLFAATFALAGPWIMGDFVAAQLAFLSGPGDATGQSTQLIFAGQEIGLRLGLALTGVLVWCGIEQSS